MRLREDAGSWCELARRVIVARIVMAGPGPAFHFVGTHEGTANPPTFKPNVWDRQRMPLVDGLQFLRTLRSKGDLSKMPVAIVTGELSVVGGGLARGFINRSAGRTWPCLERGAGFPVDWGRLQFCDLIGRRRRLRLGLLLRFRLRLRCLR